ncbi:glycosyltransferase [Empedobacter falsenii]|uniref:glycosyltransferase n=1 Tax=Empedobacter falsenii TaxID=343874 RepID=UPI001C59106F|nr:glycosyltransferase [Empedobacter falsenii]MBW1619340.1 glycosyltransferase [Empedobacter falsenii]
MKKKLSIVVLTYNQENFIEKNLEGIFMQNVNFPIELILSNDNSTDNTHKVIEEVLKKAPSHIKIIYTNHKKNLGSTPNFYNALEKVTGDYLAFCEGDDYWTDENKLQKQFDFLEDNEDYSICFHQVTNVSPDKTIDGTLFSKIEDRDYSALEIYQHWVVHTTSVFMKAKVLQTKVFDEMKKHPNLLYFDTILYMSASFIGKMRGFSDTMSAYRRHSEGLSNGINYKRDLQHNILDEIIGELYGGKVLESSDWQVFSRSRIAFDALIKKGNYFLALQHLKWILRKKGKLKVYLKKKYL